MMLCLLVLLVLCPIVSWAGLSKILYVDSYHPEYIWSQDILVGIKSVFAGHTDVTLQIVYMDTKRHQDEEHILAAAENVHQIIHSWKPHAVIAADDNAAKYVVSKCYKDHEIPFVFCGLNWDASAYGFPYQNVTGMVEVSLVTELISALSQFSQGKKIGYLASNTHSERKELENIKTRFHLQFEERLVHTFSSLKQAFVELQKTCDMVIIQECRSVKNFNHQQMIDFVQKNTQVPTGAMQKYLIHYALMTFAKVGEEQGEFAAETALQILRGASPAEIPIQENKRARIFLNTEIAKQLDVKFPIDLLEISSFVNEGIFE